MSSGPGTQPFQILLVEDNAGDSYLVRRALKGAGLDFALMVLEDGVEALAFARRDGKYAASPVPDLALLDLNLGKVGGIPVLAALRQNKELAHVPVVVMTSSSTPNDKIRAEELGVERFITKANHLEEFLEIGGIVKEVLERSAARPV